MVDSQPLSRLAITLVLLHTGTVCALYILYCYTIDTSLKLLKLRVRSVKVKDSQLSERLNEILHITRCVTSVTDDLLRLTQKTNRTSL